eukprot:gene26095-34706_t
MSQVHAICWTIPLITSLLPLTTNSYGQDDFINGYSPCVLGESRGQGDVVQLIQTSGLPTLSYKKQ